MIYIIVESVMEIFSVFFPIENVRAVKILCERQVMNPAYWPEKRNGF